MNVLYFSHPMTQPDMGQPSYPQSENPGPETTIPAKAGIVGATKKEEKLSAGSGRIQLPASGHQWPSQTRLQFEPAMPQQSEPQ